MYMKNTLALQNVDKPKQQPSLFTSPVSDSLLLSSALLLSRSSLATVQICHSMLRYLELAVHLGSEKMLGSVSDLAVEHFKQMAFFQRELLQLLKLLLIKFDLAV